MSPSVIENFVVGIVTSIVTALAVWLWEKLRKSRIINRRAAFFGLLPKERCLAVMNHNPKSPNTMSHSDVQTLIEVVRLVDEIGSQLFVAPFDEILEPAGGTTEFCIGGPDSNQRTKVHLENFLKGIHLKPYAPGDPDNIAIVTKDEKFRYEKNKSEHAVLARLYPSTNSHPVILICGQTARSNQGAIHYLIQNYDKFLRKKFGNKKQFCLIIELQSPLTYGYKSARLEKDLTDTAFIPFS
jgi:hypothetical protein